MRRLFLPLEWLHQAGIDPESYLANPEATPEIRALTARLLVTADRL